MTPARWPDSQKLPPVKRIKRSGFLPSLWRYVGTLNACRSSDQIAFQRLKQWFANRASGGYTSRRDIDPWVPLLQRLHQIRNPRPRRRSAVQQFMADYAGAVTTAFNIQYPDSGGLSSSQRMNARQNVAKTLLARDYSHLTTELDKKAVAHHDVAIEEWGMILGDISLAEDVSQ